MTGTPERGVHREGAGLAQVYHDYSKLSMLPYSPRNLECQNYVPSDNTRLHLASCFA